MRTIRCFDQRALSEEIVGFWFAAKNRAFWFRKSEEFDQELRRRFGEAHAAAGEGRLDALRATPKGALALILMADQFSRNLYRNSPKAFAEDLRARSLADNAIRRRFDMIAPKEARAFFYLPFMHSEYLIDQERSVALFTARLPASSNLWYARHHRGIIRRFGRFPHRNAVLERASTPEEIAFLKQGGFSG